MVTSWLVLVLLSFIPISGFASASAVPVGDNEPFKTEEEAMRFANNLNILNKFEAEILGVPLPPEDVTDPTTTTTVQPTTSALCSTWTICSAPCGGCGTQSRKCGSETEKVYCNTSPCASGYCCRPFFFVTSRGTGFCRRPQADAPIAVKMDNITSSTTTINPTTASECSNWSDCSAQCGGCGTQTRSCGGEVEKVFCNTQPCTDGHCCRPFIYVTSLGIGYCKHES